MCCWRLRVPRRSVLIPAPTVLDADLRAIAGAFSQVIEVKVIGATAAEPLLSHLTTSFGVEVNILRAQIDRLNDTAYAFFTVRLAGSADAVEDSIASLAQKGIAVTRLPLEAPHA